MILDSKLIFSEDQAITTLGANDSTNILDLAVADPNIGEGTKLVLHVEVSEAFASGTSAGTLSIKLQDSADASSWADLAINTKAFAIADLTAGAKLVEIALPYKLRRYLKLVYTVGTEAMTAGKVNAYISLA